MKPLLKNVVRIESKETKSRSLSLPLEIYIKDGKSVFMKLWVSPLSKIKNIDTYPEFKANDYEARVYEKIINPLLLNRACPFVVEYLGAFRQLEFDEVVSIMNGYLEDVFTGKPYKKEVVKNNIKEATYDMLFR